MLIHGATDNDIHPPYSWDKVTENTESMYRGLLDGKQA